MSLRITAGLFKGSKITSPKEIARPTSSMMREALFNILAQIIEDANFLDLFAGSGIIGIEALSRKAKYVVFVEKSKKNALNIQSNLTKLQIEDHASVICKDVLQAISQIALKFNIVFLDPPYQLSGSIIDKTLQALASAKILATKATILIETASNFIMDLQIDDFQHLKSKKYGNSSLHQFQYSSK